MPSQEFLLGEDFDTVPCKACLFLCSSPTLLLEHFTCTRADLPACLLVIMN